MPNSSPAASAETSDGETDAIKQNLVPPELTVEQKNFVYADEADLLNAALFGCTARQWRNANPSRKGNIRDYATIQQLLVLANMESYNAILITQGLDQPLRMQALRDMALNQLQTLNTLSMGNLPQRPSADQSQLPE